MSSCKGWRDAVVEGHRLESLGTKVEVRKDWKAVVGEMAQVGRTPEEVVAHRPEKLMGEMPRWQKSNPGKEGAGVASQWRQFLESQSAGLQESSCRLATVEQHRREHG